MMRIVCYQDKEISYELTLKSVKNINVRIGPGGCVKASAPPGCSGEQVDAFIQAKAPIILRAMVRTESPREQCYGEGEPIVIFGRTLTIRVQRSDVSQVLCAPPYLYVFTGDIHNHKQVRQLVEEWMETTCRDLCIGMCRQLFPQFADRGVAWPNITLRRMKSCWGSCIPAKNKITFNLKLIHVPKSCIEYVALHEMTHLLHSGHGKDFYDYISQYMPDYKERKRQLRELLRHIGW